MFFGSTLLSKWMRAEGAPENFRGSWRFVTCDGSNPLVFAPPPYLRSEKGEEGGGAKTNGMPLMSLLLPGNEWLVPVSSMDVFRRACTEQSFVDRCEKFCLISMSLLLPGNEWLVPASSIRGYHSGCPPSGPDPAKWRGDTLVQILAKIQSIINDVLEGFQRAAGAKKKLFRLLKGGF